MISLGGTDSSSCAHGDKEHYIHGSVRDFELIAGFMFLE